MRAKPSILFPILVGTVGTRADCTIYDPVPVHRKINFATNKKSRAVNFKSLPLVMLTQSMNVTMANEVLKKNNNFTRRCRCFDFMQKKIFDHRFSMLGFLLLESRPQTTVRLLESRNKEHYRSISNVSNPCPAISFLSVPLVDPRWHELQRNVFLLLVFTGYVHLFRDPFHMV